LLFDLVIIQFHIAHYKYQVIHFFSGANDFFVLYEPK